MHAAQPTLYKPSYKLTNVCPITSLTPNAQNTFTTIKLTSTHAPGAAFHTHSQTP